MPYVYRIDTHPKDRSEARMGFYFDGSWQRTHKPDNEALDNEEVEPLRPSPGKSSRTHGGGNILGIPGKMSLTARLVQRIDRYVREGRATMPGQQARETVARALESAGQPLPDALRRSLEQHAGTSLSDIRVHTGPASAEAAKALDAQAFTVGRDIHFAAGTYDPESDGGQTLLAHEVAHAIQQRGLPKIPIEQAAVSKPDQAHERLADEFAGLLRSDIEPRDREGELPAATRARMGRSFGQDLGQVRIHANSAEVPPGTKAFTRDRDIYFAPGAFAPDTAHGDEILAHELAHVVQRESTQAPASSTRALEADARQAARSANAGQQAAVHLSAPAGQTLGFSDEREPPREAEAAGNGQPPELPPPPPPPVAPDASRNSDTQAEAPQPRIAEPGPQQTAGPASPGMGPGNWPGMRPGMGFGSGGASSAPVASSASPAPATATAEQDLLMPEAPAELSTEAQTRLADVEAGVDSAATATTDLPTAEASTDTARAAVEEPTEEQDAMAQAGVVATVDDRPPPSPEIEAACERIREVIRAKRPPDEDSLVDAQPREMAAEAGGEMNAGIEERADTVRSGYDDMNTAPAGQPSREPVPAELPPEVAEVPEIDAGQAAPDELAPEDVSLDADVAAQSQRIEDAGMTTAPAELVQDGPIAEARAGLGDLDAMAESDPAAVLAEQSAAIAQAAGDMRALQEAAEQALADARAGTVGTLGTMTGDITGTEEEKRAAAGQAMQDIYQRARDSVDALLSPLSETALARWNAGVDSLATEFENSLSGVKRRIDERYESDGNWLDPRDEIGGMFHRGRDAVFGLPDWVVEEYDSAEETFATGCTDLIRDISRDVNAVIEDCQGIIEQARNDIDDLVASLPEELRTWAQGEADRIGAELDALESQVTDTQANLNQDLVDRANSAVQEVRERVNELREAAKGVLGRIADAVAAFLEDPGRAIVDGLLRVLGIPPANFWAMVDQLGDVVDGIAADPMGFANNLMAGVGQGFGQFFDNFPAHMLQGLVDWLFSRLGEAGVTIPPDFSLQSIVTVTLQVLGITWDRIRMLLARHIGEDNVAVLDKAIELVSILIEQGPSGIVEMIQDQLDPQVIMDAVLDAAMQYLMEALITRVTARILMLFNPAGAILQAIEAIYRVLSWIMNNAARIFTLIETVVSGAADVLAGNIGGLASSVEMALAGLIAPVIGFLADYIGLGGIPEAIRDVILGLQQWVEDILDRVIGFLAERAKSLLQSLGLGGDKEGPPGGEAEIGEVVRFEAAGEQHRIWIETKDGRPEIRMASDPKEISAYINAAEEVGQELENDDPTKDLIDNLVKDARALCLKIYPEARELFEDLEDGTTDSSEMENQDDHIESLEIELRNVMQNLMEAADFPKLSQGPWRPRFHMFASDPEYGLQADTREFLHPDESMSMEDRRYARASREPFRAEHYKEVVNRVAGEPVFEDEGNKPVRGQAGTKMAQRDLSNAVSAHLVAKPSPRTYALIEGPPTYSEEVEYEGQPDRPDPLSPETRAQLWAIIEKASITTSFVRNEGETEIHIEFENHAQIESQISALIKGSADLSQKSQASWEKILAQKEWHHVWPQWMMGQHEQAKFYLPRVLHNFAKTKGEGGFHQWFSSLFKESGIIELSGGKIYHEMSREAFQFEFNNLDSGTQHDIMDDFRKTLMEAYKATFKEEELSQKLVQLIDAEYDRIITNLPPRPE